MSEIIRRIDTPIPPRTMMRRLENPIRDNIPHDRIGRFEILLHSQGDFSRLVLSILHRLELFKRLFDRFVSVL